MGLKRTDEFRADAVRIALTSCLHASRWHQIWVSDDRRT